MGMVQGIIGITVGVILIVNVFMTVVKGVNTDEWSATEVAVFSLVSLLGIIGLAYGVGNVFGLI